MCGALFRNLLGEEMENRVPFFFTFLSSFSLTLLLLFHLSSAQMPGTLFSAFAYFTLPSLPFNWFPQR